MPLRTEESLQKLFEASRARQQRLKEQEIKKYRKAQETVKKALADKLSIKQEKTSQKAQEQQIEAISRIITIYHTKYIERNTADDDLYTTREQLKEAEKNNEGKINWELWQALVNSTKQILGTSTTPSTRKHRKGAMKNTWKEEIN